MHSHLDGDIPNDTVQSCHRHHIEALTDTCELSSSHWNGNQLMQGRSDELVIEESIAIAAPTHVVWHAIVDPAERAGWWSYLELDPRLGGRFEERWHDTAGNLVWTQGEVIELVEGSLLRLTWADDNWSETTQVEIRMERTDHGAMVRVRHAGWERLATGGGLAAEHRNGWRMHLGNLRDHVEKRNEAT